MKLTWPDSGRPLTPDEYRLGLPTIQSRSSASLGWSGIYVEDLPTLPANESDVPPLSHLYVVIQGRKDPGRVSMRCEDVRFEGAGPPGTVGVVPAGLGRQCRWENTVDWTFAQIDTGLVAKVAAEACGLDPARLQLRPTFYDPWPQVVAAMSALRGEVLAHGIGGRLYAESLANIIVVDLIRRITGRSALRGAAGRLAEPALRAVVEYVMDNLGDDLALADLAAAAGLSAYHFARRFKATTGQTPHQFVIGLRVERAKELIAAGGIPLAQVAAAVGFADQSHLTRHFRRIVGVTPGQFG